MAHFYGTLQGARGEASRLGHKSSGMRTVAASWAGAIVVRLEHDVASGKDTYVVEQTPWHGRGEHVVLAAGILGVVPDAEIQS